jgi:hypothetical protein
MTYYKTKILTTFALAGTFLCFANLTEAATTYEDRTSFEAAIGTRITDGYDDPGYTTWSYSNADMSAVLGETTYNSTYNIVDLDKNYYCPGCGESFVLGFDNTSVGTTEGVFGVGLDYKNDDNNPFNPNSVLFNAFVTYGDGSSENFTLDYAKLSARDYLFFALTSDLLIKSISFQGPNGETGEIGYFVMDNLTIGAAPQISAVPIPAALPLFGAGLGVMGFMGWRKKRKTGRLVA